MAGAAYGPNFHDMTSGTNGNCGTRCTASTGQDYVTGLGSPQANNIISAKNLPLRGTRFFQA
ncbi:MAG TPA: hypothetical protein VHM88_07185 [Candidatus Acidoferrales bacterium]|nr:hypothetical protein [Candidatus Acidoferrales bacterium]